MKSYVFKFYELKDDSLKSIETVKKVMEQQNELIKIIDESNSTLDSIIALKQSLIESNENYVQQIDILNKKLDIIQKILDKYEKGKADNASEKDKEIYLLVDETISEVFLGLGLVKEEE